MASSPGRILYEIFEHGDLQPEEREHDLGAATWPVQSPSGKTVALVCGPEVSFFSDEDNFEAAHGCFRTVHDAAAQAPLLITHASWTPPGSVPELLAVAISSGGVHVLSQRGKEEAEVTKPEWAKAGGLAGIAVRGGNDGENGASSSKTRGPELLMLGKEAILWRVPIESATPTTGPLSSLSASSYRPQIDMKAQHPKGAFCLAYSPRLSTVTVLGPGRFMDASGQSVPFSVSVWHLTPSAPFHRLLSSAGAVAPSRWEIFRRPAWAQIAALPKALPSPDGRHVAVLDPSNALHVLALGENGQGPVSLLPIVTETSDNVSDRVSNRGTDRIADGTVVGNRGDAGPSQQLGSERKPEPEPQSENVHDVAWWSDEALLLSRADGSVTVRKLPGLVNMLGETPERFGRSPQVTGVVGNRAFVMDAVEEEEGGDESTAEEEQQEATRGQVGILGRLSGWFRRVEPASADVSKWRLTSLVERTPLEMMGVHVRHEEYGAALSLAKLCGLDTDLVYKARWEKSGFDSASVRDNLGKVKDRRWVITECLERVPQNAEAVRGLLQYGLAETEKWKYPEAGDGWDVGEESIGVPAGAQAAGEGSSGEGEAWWFREKRLQLLRCSDLLATFLVVHNNRFSADKFAAFRRGSLKELAVQFAQAGSPGPLEVLLKRHTHSLGGAWLEVLESMPETVVPYSIRALLPGPKPPTPSVSRRPDWIESEETLTAVKNGSLPNSVAENTEELVRLSRGLVWPTGDELPEWYKARAEAIDARSGLLENSLYLLTLGVDLGVGGLEQLCEDVQDLYEVIYGGKFADASSAVDLSLGEWLKMNGFERYCTVLDGATTDDVVERLEGPADRVARRWAERHGGTSSGLSGQQEEVRQSVPGLELEGGTTSMDATEAFPRHWLLLQAEKGKLELISTVLQSQLRGVHVDKRILSQEQVFETALECVYTCPATDAWDAMASLLGALVKRGTLTPGGSPRASGDGGRKDGVKQGVLSSSSEGITTPSIASLALGPAGSKRARVAGFLQSAAERAAGQRGVASFFSRLPRNAPKGEEGGMADILANLPRRGGESAGRNAPPEEFENAEESFGSPRGGFDSGVGFEGELGAGGSDDVARNDDVVGATDVARRERLEALERRVARAERHVAAGRILAAHQTARPLSFFLTCDSDPPGVKQLLRRLLAWFSRSNPADSHWDALWADLSALQTNAFPFLDTQYLLSEFVRALLRAGRLSLARGYVTGGKKRPPLLADKAETLVLGAAKEYFYSAASLDSVEIQRARECLDLLPANPAAKADRDLVEALTVQLPKLGVELLPLQYKQLKEKEEVVTMALATNDKAYLKLPALLHIASLLGLSTSAEQDRVKALAANAAFESGDVHFALSSCLELIDESHHPAWKLAALLGRWATGTSSEFSGAVVSLQDRKKLLGFAVANVDDGGVGELLRVWEGVDLALRCEEFLNEGLGTGFEEGYLKVLLGAPIMGGYGEGDQNGVKLLKRVSEFGLTNAPPAIAVAFAQAYLPGLLSACFGDNPGVTAGLTESETERALRAGTLIRSALGDFGLPPNGGLLGRLAELAWALDSKHAAKISVNAHQEDAGSSEIRPQSRLAGTMLSILLEMDSAEGASFVERAVQKAREFAEVEKASKLAIHYYGLRALTLSDTIGPREIETLLHLTTEQLLAKLRQSPDGASGKEKAVETGFREKGLGYGARLAALKDAKGLEGVLPGVDVDRFASGDQEHQQELVLSLVTASGGQNHSGSEPPETETLSGGQKPEGIHPPETRSIEEQRAALQKALALAERYGVDRWRVVIRHVQTLLLSDWSDDDVAQDVEGHVKELKGREAELTQMLTSEVWPRLDGRRHVRLALALGLLASLWPKLSPEAQSNTANQWQPSDTSPTFPDLFVALRSAALTLATSAPDADVETLIGHFSISPTDGVSSFVQDHVTLLNAAALVALVQQLEAAYKRPSGVAPSGVYLEAVRKRFADVNGTGAGADVSGSGADVRSGTGSGADVSRTGADVSRGGKAGTSTVGVVGKRADVRKGGADVRESLAGLGKAYEDSRSAIRKLDAADLESLLSEVLHRAFIAGEFSSVDSVLKYRTRLYYDGGALLRGTVSGNGSRTERLVGLAKRFAETGAVMNELVLLRESGDVSDSQAAAAERAVPFWPGDQPGASSGPESSGKVPGNLQPSTALGPLKALVSAGAPYRAVKRVWEVVQAGGKESGEGRTDKQESAKERGPLAAGNEGLKSGLEGGLEEVYLATVDGVLEGNQEGQPVKPTTSKDSGSLQAVLAGLADNDETDGAGLAALRAAVWARVKVFTDAKTGLLRRKIQVLELLSSLEDKGGVGTGVWKGWRPPRNENSADFGSAETRPRPLLLLRTAEIVERVWPRVQVSDVSSVSAAEALFSELVHESSEGDGVSEEKAGALFGLLRLWESESGAFAANKIESKGRVESEGGENEQGERGGVGEREVEGKSHVEEGAGEEKGTGIHEPTALEKRGTGQNETGGSEAGVETGDSGSGFASAEKAAAEGSEGDKKISLFHRSAKLLLSALLTSPLPRASLVVLDRWTGDPILTREEALDLIFQTKETIGTVAAAKLALVTPLVDRVDCATELLSGWGGAKTAQNEPPAASEPPGEDGEGVAGEPGQVSDTEILSHEAESTAAARRAFNAVDADLLGLALANGLLPKIAHKGGVPLLRALCLALTPLAQTQQELLLNASPNPGVNPLAAVAFSCFVADLTACHVYAFAGALVLQYLHVPPALATWDGAPEALLRYLRYLKRKLPQQVRIARGFNKALLAEKDGGFTCDSYLTGPVEEIAKGVVRLSSKALNTLVQDLK